MIITVQCPSCETSFPVDTHKVPEGGVDARCSVCAGIFPVDRPADDDGGRETGAEQEGWDAVSAAASTAAPPEAAGAGVEDEALPSAERGGEPEPVTGQGELADLEVTADPDLEPWPEVDEEPEAPAGGDEAAAGWETAPDVEPESEVEPEDVVRAPWDMPDEEAGEVVATEPVETDLVETGAAGPETVEAEVEDETDVEGWTDVDDVIEGEAVVEVEEEPIEVEEAPEVEEPIDLEEGPEVEQPLEAHQAPGTAETPEVPETPEMPEAPEAEEKPAAPAAGAHVPPDADMEVVEPDLDAREPDAGVVPETVSAPSEPPSGFQFGKRDPHEKAQRLARVLVSDMIMYNPERHGRALDGGTLKEDFEDEIKKSWDEYVDQVGQEIAESTTYFSDALNDILARGESVFEGNPPL